MFSPVKLRAYLLQLLREDLFSVEVQDIRGYFVELNPLRFTDDYQNCFEFSELQQVILQEAANHPGCSCFEVDIQYGFLVYKKIPNIPDWWFWDLQADPNDIVIRPIQAHPMELRSVYDDPEVKQAQMDRSIRDRNRAMGSRTSYMSSASRSSYVTPSKNLHFGESQPSQLYSGSRHSSDILTPQNLGMRPISGNYTSPGGSYYPFQKNDPTTHPNNRAGSPLQGTGPSFFPQSAQRGNLQSNPQEQSDLYNFPVAAKRKDQPSATKDVPEPVSSERKRKDYDDKVLEEDSPDHEGSSETKITIEELNEAVQKGFITLDDLVFSKSTLEYCKKHWDKLLANSF